MLKTLVKKQLMEIFRSYFYNAKTNKKRSTAGIIAYILLFAALMIGLGGMFTGLSVSLCAPLTQAGMGWLYFALMSLLAIFLGAFGSVFTRIRACTSLRTTTCCCLYPSRCGR